MLVRNIKVGILIIVSYILFVLQVLQELNSIDNRQPAVADRVDENTSFLPFDNPPAKSVSLESVVKHAS